MPGKIQIAYGIQHLVLHKLVVVAQATLIEDAIVINDDRIIHAAAAGQPARPHIFELMDKAEGSRTADLADEGLATDIQCGAPGLLPEHGMIKIDGKGDSEAVVGFERCGFITVADGDRLSHPDKAFGLLLFFDTGRLQQVNKRARGAVHDWHFCRVHIDVGIVDTQTAERRQQMLYGRDSGLA